MRVRSSVRVIALGALLALGAAACGSSPNPPASSGPGTSPTQTATQGGSAVLGAEQWPQCLNPITSCSFASWYYYTTAYYVLPRLVQYDLQGNAAPSALITDVPTLDNGGIVENPFTITYHLNPKAVWSDGTPITSADVDFTLKAIINTKGTVSTVGYDSIDTIDTTDPLTVKINFKQVFVDWPDLFGGSFGFVLEKAAFPTADATAPDLAKEMNTAISFSGGPWVLQSWSKDQEVLVRNTKFWGQQTYLDQVTFVPRIEQQTEIASLLSGEVAAIFPQPSNVSLLDQFKQNPAVKAVGGSGNYDEALWFQLDTAPMDDPAVRQAVAYAVDRQTIIDDVIKLNNPDAVINNCGLIWFPGVGPWCPATGPFAQYTYDPAKAQSLLTADGYTVGSDGICTKGGQKLTLTINTTAGNARRESITSIIKEKGTAACIDFAVKFQDPTDLFSNTLPKGTFQIALYASGGSLDPGVTGSFACDQIPTAANSYAGANTDHWCNDAATAIMKASDQDLDITKRAGEIQQIGAAEAADLPALPIEVLPNVAAWRGDKLAGPIGDYVSSPYGFFFNMDQWYAAA